MPISPIIVGGAIIGFAIGSSHDPAQAAPVGQTPPLPSTQPSLGGARAATIGAIIQTGGQVGTIGTNRGMRVGGGYSSAKNLTDSRTSIKTSGNQPNKQSDDTLGNQVADYVDAKVKKQIDGLGQEAKQAGADYLNKTLKPSPDIKASDSAEEISKKVGASIGGAAAAAGCAAIPGGATASPLCAMAGAYLGNVIGGYVKEGYDKVEQGLKDGYNYVEGQVKDAVNSSVDWVKSLV